MFRTRASRLSLVILQVADRRIELDREVLRSDGVLVPVGRTAVRLLSYLASNQDRIVSTEELLREVWDGVRVTPASVQQAVRSLRAALGGRSLALIRTVRGRGYQLEGSIEVIEPAPAAHGLPLVGRSAQLGRLSEAVESARAGRGRLVLVTGPPGIGKTRLLCELEALAPARGFRFVLGHCPEESDAAALCPWEEILQLLVANQPPPLESGAASDLLVLQAAFPALAAGTSALPPALDPGSARFRLYEAARRVLVACARTRPLVLAIDDLHRADEGSVRLLAWIAERIAGAPILIVASYRDHAVRRDSWFRGAVGTLLRIPGISSERLPSLSRDQVEQVVRSVGADAISARDLEALWLGSAGNPFLLEILLHPLKWGGRSEGVELPSEYGGALRRLVDVVSPPTQELLSRAALLGRDIDPETLGLLSGATSREVFTALEEAVAAELVERRPNGSLRFVHALVVESLREALDADLRLALHARAAEILATRVDASSIAAVAEHASRAAEVIGFERATACCERAAEAALERYAFEEAARLYARALEFAQDAGLRRRLALLLALGESLAHAGQAQAASEALQQATGLAKTVGDDASYARAVLVVAVMRGDEIEQVDPAWIHSLEEAIELHRTETPLRARLLSRLAAVLWQLPPRERARELARESVRLAHQVGDPDALASVLTRAYRVLQTGPGDDATRAETVRALESAVTRASDPLVALNARTALLWEALVVGDRRAFDEQVMRIVQEAEAVGAPQAAWCSLAALASRAQLTGQLERAEALSEEGLAVGEASGIRVARQHYALQQFAIRWAQGRLEEIEPTFASTAESPLHPLAWRVGWGLAELAAGRVAPARGLLHEFCADPARVPCDAIYAGALDMLADIAAQLCDARASEVLLPLIEPLRARHHVVGLGYCHMGASERQLGRLLGVLERWEEAEAALESALNRDRRLGAVVPVAHDQHALGTLLLRRGRSADRERARGLLEESGALARDLGIARLEQACADVLPGAQGSG
jgi:DNA-binding winged helix-turn-helix (wHTH) protein/tetratricopeptide (TPR) repeat protein